MVLRSMKIQAMVSGIMENPMLIKLQTNYPWPKRRLTELKLSTICPDLLTLNQKIISTGYWGKMSFPSWGKHFSCLKNRFICSN